MGGALGRLAGLIKLIRYRFLLVAGLLPYALGAALAFHVHQTFDLFFFLAGLLGLFFALLGVEAFNEYFDWQSGTDRVFQLHPKPVTKHTFFVGWGAFFLAGLIGVYLSWQVGWAIIIFAGLGFGGAYCYLGPPLKLTYRGLGELVIALCYGPLMTAGSFYLQAHRLEAFPLLVTLVPGLLLFAIALVNEVPDFLQDRLVGKRNLCVRLGPKTTVRLYSLIMVGFYHLVPMAYYKGIFPGLTLWALLCIPLSLVSFVVARKSYENPRRFVLVIRLLLIQYVLVLGLFITAYLQKP